jgi:hypothetical protein
MHWFVVKSVTFHFVVICLFGLSLSSAAQDAHGQAASPADAPKQPIDFSHKIHAGTAKMPCKMCHPNPDPGEMMTIVGATNCMQCHSAIKADSPEIKRLAEYAKTSSPIPWVPVYELPSFVKFNHRVHLQAGNTCQDCHGPVAERDHLFREVSLTMGACMSCHQAKKATLDCAACHELPN